MTVAAQEESATDDLQADQIEHQFALLFDMYRSRVRAQAAEIDPALQPSGYRTLLELVVVGPASAGALAEQVGFDKSVLSRQLQQLERLGLISRAPDPADRRSVTVSATADAVDRIRRIRSGARDQFRRGLGRWPEDDLLELSRLLGNLVALTDDLA